MKKARLIALRGKKFMQAHLQTLENSLSKSILDAEETVVDNSHVTAVKD
jgi:hypothetical protein